MENSAPQSGRKAVIVGGGLGGLITACLLAKKGLSVRLYETDTWLGGDWRTYQAGGHYFDAGPVWLEHILWWRKIFASLDIELSDHEVIRLDPALAIHRENGRVFRWKLPRYADNGQLEAAFYRWVDKQNDVLRKRMQKSAGVPAVVYTDSLLWMAKGLDLGITWHRRIQHYKELSDGTYPLWTILPAIHSLDSAHIPAAAVGWWSYPCHQGIYYPKGGFSVLIRLLEQKARQLGAEIITGVKVYNIGVRDGVAHKVTVESEEIPADVIVSNAGYRYTETALLGVTDRQFTSDEWDSITPNPVLRVFVGLKGKLEGLHHQNVVTIDEKPVFVAVPSRTDPTLAPEDGETVIIRTMIFEAITDSVTLREAAGQLVKETGKALGIADWDQRIAYQAGECLTVEGDCGKTGRRPLHSKRVNNLYFVGSDLIQGGGELSSLYSAAAVVQEITGHDALLNLMNLSPSN
jgi:phytoene desaturase